jgi:hypothetical protein
MDSDPAIAGQGLGSEASSAHFYRVEGPRDSATTPSRHPRFLLSLIQMATWISLRKIV